MGKSDGIADQQIFVTGEKINSSGSIEQNFPQFEKQFWLRCKTTCIHRNVIVLKTIFLTSSNESLAPLLLKISVLKKFVVQKNTIGN